MVAPINSGCGGAGCLRYLGDTWHITQNSVEVETVGAVPAIKNGDIMGNFYVQVGAFSRKDNAERLVAKFKSQGLNARMYYVDYIYLWRVQAGPYPSVNAAESARGDLLAHYPGSFVVGE